LGAAQCGSPADDHRRDRVPDLCSPAV